ncbi:MAG TPA: Dam family site-specific DNA-(adenine-N6)-methyltransferase, partial [Chroococcales cyanobacterium]
MLEIRSAATERLRIKRSGKTLFTPGPFLKWAGGKSQLLPTFVRYFPKKFNRYHEPFLGGGAVFFHLASRIPQMRATISDGNEELINCYKMIRDYPYEVLEALKLHRNDKHHFYKIRAQDTARLSNPERAARLVFLNKTCFNGLYRVNRSGQFNVPFGKYKNPKFVDEKNIFAVSDILTHADILHSPFETILQRAKKGDFVYL